MEFIESLNRFQTNNLDFIGKISNLIGEIEMLENRFLIDRLRKYQTDIICI